MNLSEIIEKSGNWLNFCSELIDDIGIDDTERKRVAGALLHLSIEHSGSIHILILNKHYGSAFALLRPQFESYVRGVWFQNSASQDQVSNYINNKEPPHINELINEIQDNPGYEQGTLKKAKDKVWRAMCDYTHGGYFQVAYRNTNLEIINDYEDKYLIELLLTASNITYLTAIAMARLSKCEQIAAKATDQHKELFSEILA